MRATKENTSLQRDPLVWEIEPRAPATPGVARCLGLRGNARTPLDSFQGLQHDPAAL